MHWKEGAEMNLVTVFGKTGFHSPGRPDLQEQEYSANETDGYLINVWDGKIDCLFAKFPIK